MHTTLWRVKLALKQHKFTIALGIFFAPPFGWYFHISARMERRKFIKTGLQVAALMGAASFPLESLAGTTRSLCILHTNDVHSRLDPFPMDGGKYQGLGGVVNRERIISKIREAERNVLLLDAGDMFQGTPYYNLYKGEAEIKMMNLLGYDAATLGNHDFDNGIEALAENSKQANFPLLNCNYDLRKTPLNDKVAPYKILRKQGLKIGIIGAGVQLQGLVLPSLYGNASYTDPVRPVNRLTTFLKKTKKCDYVICLSHLGYRYKNKKISDVILAQKTEHLDLIIGGHTHTFLKKPTELQNKNGKLVLVNQVGWAGINIGKINVKFEQKTGVKYHSNLPVKISK
jgi:5'-nucleotidase